MVDRTEAVAEFALATKIRDADALLTAMVDRWPDLRLVDYERGLALAAERLLRRERGEPQARQ